MLSKILKQDLKSFLPLWLFFSAIALGASTLLGPSLNMVIYYNNAAVLVLGVLGFTLSVAVLSGYMIATVVFVGIRFYQNFYTDEGYLTFTLPVKRSTLYLSKVLSGSIFVFSSLAVVIASVCCALLLVPTSSTNSAPVLFRVLDFLWSVFELVFSNIPDNVTMILCFVVCVLIFIALEIFEVLTIYLCITVGSVIAKKLKVLVSIVCYYAVNTVIGIASSIGQIFLTSYTYDLILIIKEMPIKLVGVAILLVLVCVLGFMIALTSLIYYTTNRLIERRLNLP